MKKLTLLALTLLACVASCLAGPNDYVVKKVEVDFPPSPDMAGGGIRWTPQKWVRIDVTFDAIPDFTEELQFTYYALVATRPGPDRLLTGKVAHVNIGKGNGLHSVMYISPQSLIRFWGERKPQFNYNAGSFFTQIAVVVTKPGAPAPVATGLLKQVGHGEWWTGMKQEEGFLVNKNETPFAPLTWDYYEAIKPASGR